MLFSFIPARFQDFDTTDLAASIWAKAWSFLTYSFLHGSWMHLFVNCAWFLVFATPLVKRFSTLSFLAFLVICSIGGALAHLIWYYDEVKPMIGASAMVSGLMAAGFRYLFSPYALTIRKMLTSKVVLTQILVWFGLNLVIGIIGFGTGGSITGIAWQAHVGGFLAGLFAFPLFDRLKGG